MATCARVPRSLFPTLKGGLGWALSLRTARRRAQALAWVFMTGAPLLVPAPLVAQSPRPRARDIGLVVGSLPPGPLNAITDVAGVRVGHTTIARGDSINTGITAILPHGGNLFRDKVPAAIVVGNGFGKLAGSTQVNELGELESPILLTCTLCVPRAADAVLTWLLGLPGNEDVRSANPVVAETNDGYLNTIRARPITEADVLAAIRGAAEGPVAEGAEGAGRGTVAFGWKGGIGTATRRADPALPAERHRPPSRALRPFSNGPLGRSADRGKHVRLRNRPRADGVEIAVIRLGHDGVGRPNVLVPRQAEEPGEHRVGGAGDAQRAGQHDGRLELPQLVHLGRSRQLAESIPDDDRGRHLVAKRIPTVREDRGDAGVDRVAAGDRGVADAHPRDIGDRVEGAGGERTDNDAHVSRSGARGLGEGWRGGEGQDQENAERGSRNAEQQSE